VIGINLARTELRSGQVDLPDGFEHYLLKFDGVVEHSQAKETFGDPQGFGRMEYAYYLMAQAAGIHMSPCELLLDGDRAHFMTKRFDRIGNKKVHYQSLCAMDHADYKKPGHYSYEQVFSLMRALKLNKSTALEMYRRMVFNIVARNHDDHSKNTGFILNAQHQWELSPAFDIAYSYKPDSPWVNAHQLSLNGKRDHFVRRDLLLPAEKFRKEAETIIEEVIDVVAQWPKYAKAAGVFPDFAQEIQRHHRLTFL
jgi:serine/threonine-protein kinase HipA